MVFARPDAQEEMSIPLQSASLYGGQEVCTWSNCLLDLGTDFIVGNMFIACDAYYLAAAPHFHGIYSSLQLCCQGPWFTSIQEDGWDKETHQLYLGTERNVPVVPNWFEPCQCCSHLSYSGEYLRLGTLIGYNWKLVTISSFCPFTLLWYPRWCCWCCHQLGLLGTDLHTIGYVETLN